MSGAEKLVALVTGANKGLGWETARRLAELGFLVLIGARDEGRGLEAAKRLTGECGEAHFLQLEVTNLESVRAAALHIEKRYGCLDVLVNNAAVLFEADFQLRAQSNGDFMTLPSSVSLEVLQQTFATNFFGAVAVLNACLPLLRRSRAGRVVNVSSRLASMTETTSRAAGHLPLLAYNASKAALNCATVQFAFEVRNTPLKINSAAPLHCATDLNGLFGSRTPAEAIDIIVKLATLPADGPSGGFFADDGRIPW
jgi:NAD(P)-dependent dehydrogenase (short-subunit alcohol dehydrogenase family)